MYVPQARVPLKGTPTEFYFHAQVREDQKRHVIIRPGAESVRAYKSLLQPFTLGPCLPSVWLG